MIRILTASTVIALLFLPGCSDQDPTAPPPDPPTEYIYLDHARFANEHLEVSMDLILARRGPAEWKQLSAEFRNLTGQTLHYDIGSCGCPVSLLLYYDKEGRECPRIRPLCPCEAGPVIRDFGPHRAVSVSSLVLACGGVEHELHELVFQMIYYLDSDELPEWRSFKASYVLPPGSESAKLNWNEERR
jgi:hypothetical protein